MDATDAQPDTPDGPTEADRQQYDAYEEVSPDDVTEDAIDFLRQGADDPQPATPPPTEGDEPPPPNA